MLFNRPFFELISKYEGQDELLPERATKNSAGYDFIVAEDIVVPSYQKIFNSIQDIIQNPISISDLSQLTKKYGCKPTLVPTGVKAFIPKCYYLQLSVRSSCPLKNWLILANGVGVIDADYYNNPDNEGHIFFQLINLFPSDIQLKKGDKIGQGIFIPYVTTSTDKTTIDRVGGFGSTDK